LSSFIPRIIIGLGNPKSVYDDTRHNAGKRLIEYLAEGKSKLHHTRQAHCYTLRLVSPSPITGCVPTSFMNESGPALKRILDTDGIDPKEILVAVDDFMIPFGSLRLRPAGSAGGHNGLKSIIEVLGTEEFGRLRIGIGPVPDGKDPADFVLQPFKKVEKDALTPVFHQAQEGLELLIQQGYQKAMSFLNQ